MKTALVLRHVVLQKLQVSMNQNLRWGKTSIGKYAPKIETHLSDSLEKGTRGSAIRKGGDSYPND